jgi:4-hydroxybenzoate polyprenyltransferase
MKNISLISSQWLNYIRLMRLDKPIGIFLLLWPTLMALFIAGNGKPDPFIVCVFVLGTIIMRSAGCVINDLADYQFDKEVTRTKTRPLAVGLVSKREAFVLFLGLVCFAFVLAIQLNFLTMQVAMLALSLATVYPFMKRYTHLPQLVLAAAFGSAIPMAFTALTHSIPLEAILLFMAMFCWTVAYDTQYAMADKMDDLRIGVKSTAILFGKFDRVMIWGLQLFSLLLLVFLGILINLGITFYFGIMVAFGCSIYQQYLIKDRDPKQCLQAFLNNNYFGIALFLGLLANQI